VREDKSFEISPSQGFQIMALAEMLKNGDVSFRGDEQEDEQSAAALIADVAQEIALQVGVVE
jgi:hypothetical protein